MNLTLRQKGNGEGGLAKGDLRVFYDPRHLIKGFSHPDYPGFEMTTTSLYMKGAAHKN
jgi:hypothetical protein